MNRFDNSFITKKDNYSYYNLQKVFEKYPKLKKLPISLKILLESNLRNTQNEDIDILFSTFEKRNNFNQINFYPNRVLLNEEEGIPLLVDLASFRENNNLENQNNINPKITVDLIMDNILNESKYKKERKEKYEFLKWASYNFENFSIFPPSSNGNNEINLEYLSTIISSKQIDEEVFVYPEAIVGIDLNTADINALGIIAFNLGFLELESIILGSKLSFDFPKVIGFEITGTVSQGISSLDILVALNEIIKKHDIKDQIVEFYGKGLKNISIEDRASLANEVSKNEALCGFFPMDGETIVYLERTRGVDVTFIKEYFNKQSFFENEDEIIFDNHLKLDLSLIKPLVIGPKDIRNGMYAKDISNELKSFKKGNFVKDNDIALALISSNMSSSNIIILIQAGLLAKKAFLLGLSIGKNIRTYLYLIKPIQKKYLESLELLQYFEKLGFILVDNYTNELEEIVSLDIEKFNLNLAFLSSSTIAYEEMNNPQIKSKYLLSPSLLIGYCLKGNINLDITKEPLFQDIYLSDIWPSTSEINEYLGKIDTSFYKDLYKNTFLENKEWFDIKYEDSNIYKWDENSTYIRKTSFPNKLEQNKLIINNANILALFGDNISTDEISPYGNIPTYSQVSSYLTSKDIHPDEFNTFKSRKGNAQIMTRAVLSNNKLKNKIVHPKEGGYTKDFTNGEIMTFFDFSIKMKEQKIPLVIFSGKNFGNGNPKDWASKGLKLLGVEVVIAESFNDKYKLDLILMGILPLEFIDDDINSLNLKGNEQISINIDDLKSSMKIKVEINKDENIRTILLKSCIDSKEELEFYKNAV